MPAPRSAPRTEAEGTAGAAVPLNREVATERAGTIRVLRNACKLRVPVEVSLLTPAEAGEGEGGEPETIRGRVVDVDLTRVWLLVQTSDVFVFIDAIAGVHILDWPKPKRERSQP